MDTTTLLLISAVLIGAIVVGFLFLMPKQEEVKPLDTSSALKTMEEIDKTISNATSGPTTTQPAQPQQALQQTQNPQEQSQQQTTSTVQPPLQLSNEYIQAFGEGYGKTELEAEEAAKNNGLKNLTEQLYVQVKTSSELREKLTTKIQDGKVKERFESQYEKTIQTKTDFELTGVTYRLTDRKKSGNQYYAQVQVYIDAQRAKQLLEAYFAINLCKTLVDNKMIFTAKSIVDKYEPLVASNQFPPKIAEELTNIIFQIKGKYERVQGLVKNINSTKVKDMQSALDTADLVNQLFAVAGDLPNGTIDTERLREHLKDVKIVVSGPKDVLIGEQVKLEVSVEPSVVKSLVIFGEEVETQDLVTLQNGSALLSAVVKSPTSKVIISLAGIIDAVWAPGSVTQNPDILRTMYKDENEVRILAGGTAKIVSDQKIMRENALKDALVKTVKKVASELFAGNDRELLDIPIDDYILNKVLGNIDYEISATGEYGGLYYVLVSSRISKRDFETYVKDALKNAPAGFAMVLTEGDTLGYIEPALIDSLISSGIKLVSKDFSRKVLETQAKSNLPPTVLAKMTALSAARYLLYVTVNNSSAYLSDYKVYSVRTLITTQIIDTITGNIVAAPRFEEVNTGATEQAAISKTTSSQKFKDYINTLVSLLKFENVAQDVVYKYTFILERAIYGSMLLDYLNAKFSNVKVIEKTDTKVVVEIENVSTTDLEKYFSGIDTLKFKKISEYNYQVTK